PMSKGARWQRWLKPLTRPLVARTGPRRRALGRHTRRGALGLEELENRLAPANTVSISDGSVLEPLPGGSVDLNFTVTRSGALDAPLTVGYTTVPGTAQPDRDFRPTTGTVLLPAGAATAVIGIPVFGNGVHDAPSLTFSVRLTGIVDAPPGFTAHV